MLILVGVSVTVTLNGGLFSTTEKAKEQTEIAMEKETIARALYGALSDNNGRLIKSTVESWLNEEFVVDVLNAEHVHNVDGTDVDYTDNCWMLGTEELNEGYPVFKSNQN